jgi:hypothetical protein
VCWNRALGGLTWVLIYELYWRLCTARCAAASILGIGTVEKALDLLNCHGWANAPAAECGTHSAFIQLCFCCLHRQQARIPLLSSVVHAFHLMTGSDTQSLVAS